MTLSETRSDKFCQSPFVPIFIFQASSEAETPILGTLTSDHLAAAGIFTAETPRTPRESRGKTGRKGLAQWSKLGFTHSTNLLFLAPPDSPTPFHLGRQMRRSDACDKLLSV
jgi:hypothetical protein